MRRIYHRAAVLSACVLTLLVSSCAQILNAPSPKAAAVTGDFIWSRTALANGLDFYVDKLGTGVTHTLTSTDGTHILDNTDTAGFLLRSDVNDVTLDSIGKNSIFSLPAGFTFAPTSTTATHLLGINAVLSVGSAVYVATNSGVYSSLDEIAWKMVLPGNATVLAQDSQKTVYAAIGDSIYSLSSYGNSWVPMPTPHTGSTITALACRSTGGLYVGYGGGLGVDYIDPRAYAGYWNTLPAKFTYVNAIAVQVIGGLTMVIVADSVGFVTMFHDSTQVAASDNLPGVDCLLFDDTGGSYAGSYTQGLYNEPLYQASWNPVPNTIKDKITGMAVDANGQEYAVSFNGPILPNRGGNFNPLGALRPSARNVACSASGALLIGTDSGLWVVSPAGTLQFVTGPFDSSRTSSSSGLVLLDRAGLQSNSSQPEGASWFGGSLVGPGLISGIPITARIQDHVDSLRVPNPSGSGSTTYGESFVIRYAPESANQSVTSGFPLYWIVYYSRGVGPVLIQEYILGSNQTYTIQEQATLVPKK